MATVRKDPAFTLVELLAVVAIIGLLAALLLAGVAEAKAKAMRIQCANNVRQLGIGLQAFVADNGVYPLCSNPNYRKGVYPTHTMMWMTALQYTEISVPRNSTNRISFGAWAGQGVWKCPSANKPSNWPDALGYESYGYNAYGMSPRIDTNALGLGGHHVWQNDSIVPAPPISESEVASPSSMMAIGDGFQGGNGIMEDGAFLIGRTYGIKAVPT